MSEDSFFTQCIIRLAPRRRDVHALLTGVVMLPRGKAEPEMKSLSSSLFIEPQSKEVFLLSGVRANLLGHFRQSSLQGRQNFNCVRLRHIVAKTDCSPAKLALQPGMFAFAAFLPFQFAAIYNLILMFSFPSMEPFTDSQLIRVNLYDLLVPKQQKPKQGYGRDHAPNPNDF
jgi:hypothetical protein